MKQFQSLTPSQYNLSTTACYIATFCLIYLIQYPWLGLDVSVHPLAYGFPVLTDPHHMILAMYTHSSLTHLVKNVAMIAAVGVIFEQKTTTRQYHAFFLTIAIVASSSELLLNCEYPCVGVVGASSGIFAILGYNIGSHRLVQSLCELTEPQFMRTLTLAVIIAAISGGLTLRPGGAPVAHGGAVFCGVILGRYELFTKLNEKNPVRTLCDRTQTVSNHQLQSNSTDKNS